MASNGLKRNTALHAAIIGGGIGGLAAANAFARRGIRVSVFEQASPLREVGAGIGIFPNCVRLLSRMGFAEKLADIGVVAGEGSAIRNSDDTLVTSIVRTDSSGCFSTHFVHRADLLTMLSNSLPPGSVRTGHRCVELSMEPDVATVRFANGETIQADVVIAADGIRSQLQRYVVPPSVPVYSGFRAYRGLIARDKLGEWRDGTHQIWVGEGKHFMVFPVRRGSLLNYVGFVPTDAQTEESWSAIGDRTLLASAFAGWNPQITRLLESIESCFWWGLYDRAPLQRWTNHRLALLGDAAHPMLPHLGQGANQAIEDGVGLAVLLENRKSEDVSEILCDFQNFRRARTGIVQAETRRNGLRYDSQVSSLKTRDEELRDSAKFRRWLFDYDVEQAAADFREGVSGARASGREGVGPIG